MATSPTLNSGMTQNAAFAMETGLFSFTPVEGQRGRIYTFVFTARDCRDQTTSASVTIVVEGDGAAPRAALRAGEEHRARHHAARRLVRLGDDHAAQQLLP